MAVSSTCLEIFQQIIMKAFLVELIFGKFYAFSIFFWRPLEECIWSMEYDNCQETSYFRHWPRICVAVENYKSSSVKPFNGNALKMKAVKSNLGNKDQRVMLPTVSQSDETLMKIFSISCFLIRQLFRATIFYMPNVLQVKLCPGKLGIMKLNLSRPSIPMF